MDSGHQTSYWDTAFQEALQDGISLPTEQPSEQVLPEIAPITQLPPFAAVSLPIPYNEQLDIPRLPSRPRQELGQRIDDIGSVDNVPSSNANTLRRIAPAGHKSPPETPSPTSKMSMQFVNIRHPSGKCDAASGPQIRSHVMEKVFHQRRIKDRHLKASKVNRTDSRHAVSSVDGSLGARGNSTQRNGRKASLSRQAFAETQPPSLSSCSAERPDSTYVGPASTKRAWEPVVGGRGTGSSLRPPPIDDDWALISRSAGPQNILQTSLDPFATTKYPASLKTHELLHYCEFRIPHLPS